MTLVQSPVWLTWRSARDKNAAGTAAVRALPAFSVGSDFAIGRPVPVSGRTIEDRDLARSWPPACGKGSRLGLRSTAARPDRIRRQIRREPEDSSRAVAIPSVLASIPVGSAPEAAQ